MKKIEVFVEGKINGKIILLLFVLTNLVYTYMLLVSIPETMKFSNGLRLLDMMPLGYDFNYVNQLFHTLGADGRNTYLSKQIPIDMIYPLLFGLTYCLILGFFLNKMDWLKRPWIYLCFLPIIAGTADYIENIGILYMLNTYPEITVQSVNSTNIFSVTKSISTSIYFFVLILVLIRLGYQVLHQKTKL